MVTIYDTWGIYSHPMCPLEICSAELVRIR